MSDHGPQFDRFPSAPGHLHGGSYFDEFGKPSARSDAHGRLMDTFVKRQTESTGHGAQYDDGWTVMPDVPHNGAFYDDEFAQPVAMDGSDEHGTWHDVFTSGRGVRYVYEGKSYEGTVLNAGDGVLFVAPSKGGANGGGRHEIGLPQVEAFAQLAEDAPKLKAEPGHTDAPFERSTAEAPSAHDAKAHGGERHDGTAALKAAIDLLEDVGDVAKAGATQAYAVRQGKVATGPWCRSCAKVAAGALTGGTYGVHKTTSPTRVRGCSSCGRKVQSVHVAKTDDETFDVAKTTEILDVAKAAALMATHCSACDKGIKTPRYAAPAKLVGKRCAGGCGRVYHKTGSWMAGGDVGKAIDVGPVVAKGQCPDCGNHASLHQPDGTTQQRCATCTRGTIKHAQEHGIWQQKSAAEGADVAKAIDATETAVQGETTAKTVGHRRSCPRGGSAPCGAEQAGKCSICDTPVRDHEALGKSIDALRSLA